MSVILYDAKDLGALWEALTSLRYNIIANSGKSFFSADDCERLDNLINRLGYNIISRAK